MHSHVVEFLAAVFACFNVLSIIARRCLKSLKVKSEVQILFKLSRFRKWNTHTVQQTLGITKKKWVIKEQNLPNLCYSDVPKWTLVKLDHFPCLARDRKSPQRRIIAHIFGKEVVCIGEKSVSQAACLLSEVNKYYSRAFIRVIAQHFIAKGSNVNRNLHKLVYKKENFKRRAEKDDVPSRLA